MSLSQDEKQRREAKKLYEIIDDALLNSIKDPEVAGALIEQLAKVDPKLYINTVLARLPKVQPTDQDLQKTLISLKSMMIELPEVEDIIGKLHGMQGKLNAANLANTLLKKDMEVQRKKFRKILESKE